MRKPEKHELFVEGVRSEIGKGIFFLIFLILSLCILPKSTEAEVTVVLDKAFFCWSGKSSDARIKVVNTSSSDIRIQEISTDCGCVVVLWNREKIRAGKETDISMRIRCGYEVGRRDLTIVVAYRDDSITNSDLVIKQMKADFVVLPSPVKVYPVDNYVGLLDQQASFITIETDIKILDVEHSWQLSNITSEQSYKFSKEYRNNVIKLIAIKKLDPKWFGVFEDNIALSFSKSTVNDTGFEENIRITYVRERDDIKVKQLSLNAIRTENADSFEGEIDVIIPSTDRLVSVGMGKDDSRVHFRIKSVDSTHQKVFIAGLPSNKSSIAISLRSARGSKWMLSLPIIYVPTVEIE